MINIKKKVLDFHSKAKSGRFSECKKCPRNPSENKTIYASTCLKHFEIHKNGLLIIMRDPGDKGAKSFLKLFNEIKIPHSHIYFCNAVLHGFVGKNITPSEFELGFCNGVIANLFEILSPKIIFALGKEALESSFEILSKGKIIKASMNMWVEKKFYFGVFNSTHLFSMPHISYCVLNLRNFGF